MGLVLTDRPSKKPPPPPSPLVGNTEIKAALTSALTRVEEMGSSKESGAITYVLQCCSGREKPVYLSLAHI